MNYLEIREEILESSSEYGFCTKSSAKSGEMLSEKSKIGLSTCGSIVEQGVCRKADGIGALVTVAVPNMSKPPMRLSELRGEDMVLLNMGPVLIGWLTVVAGVVTFELLLFRSGSRKSSKQSNPGRNPSTSGDPRGEISKERSKSVRSSNEFVELGGEGGN